MTECKQLSKTVLSKLLKRLNTMPW